MQAGSRVERKVRQSARFEAAKLTAQKEPTRVERAEPLSLIGVSFMKHKEEEKWKLKK